jgi:hypothetical protein
MEETAVENRRAACLHFEQPPRAIARRGIIKRFYGSALPGRNGYEFSRAWHDRPHGSNDNMRVKGIF